jgi:TPR repeat protein
MATQAGWAPVIAQLVVFLALSMAAAGAETPPANESNASPDGSLASIYIFRDRSFVASAGPVRPSIDGTPMPFSLWDNSFGIVQLAPGEHTVTLTYVNPRGPQRLPNYDLRVTLQSGGRYFLKDSWHFGRSSPTMALVPEQTIRTDLQRARLMGTANLADLRAAEISGAGQAGHTMLAAEELQSSDSGTASYGRDFDRGMTAFRAADYQKAMEAWTTIAKQGHPRAEACLAYLYAHGMGVPEDDTKAVDLYRQATEQGDAAGENGLANMYENGRGGLTRNLAEAVKWYRQSADQNFAEAAANLGVMYQNGWGVPRSDAEAVTWYRKAAEHGNAAGELWLSWMYLNGQGVAANPVEAAIWARKAADQGFGEAENNLGYMYENGIGGLPRDLDEAKRWYGKAARQHVAAATKNLQRLGGK